MISSVWTCGQAHVRSVHAIMSIRVRRFTTTVEHTRGRQIDSVPIEVFGARCVQSV